MVKPKDHAAWREWLAKNNVSSKGVWVVIPRKNSDEPGVSLDEAVDEAVAFGWIDSKQHPIDEKQYRLLFTPRKPGSIWSKSNKQRVERLQQQGRMTPAGLAKVEAAKRDGSWNRLNEVEALKVQEDLRLVLAADRTAQDNFDSWNDSSKKQALWWIESAKRPETRRTRIRQIVTWARQNDKSNPLHG